MFFWFLILSICFCIEPSFTMSVPCYEVYKAPGGNSCYPCLQGNYKVSDCEPGSKYSSCQRCKIDTYQPDCNNSTKCISCRSYCQKREKKVKNCSETNDIVCQCIDGYFMQNDLRISEGGYCKRHSKCKPGEGLTKKGTPYKDTICQPCQERVTFSNNTSLNPCKPCSSCNNAVIQNCTSTQDAVCAHKFTEGPGLPESSSTGKGIGKIVGIVVGAVVAVVAIKIVQVLIRCRRQNDQKHDSEKRNDIELPEAVHTGIDEIADKHKPQLPEHNASLTKHAYKHPEQNGCSNGFAHHSENFNQTAIVNGKTVFGKKTRQSPDKHGRSNTISKDKTQNKYSNKEPAIYRGLECDTAGKETSKSKDDGPHLAEKTLHLENNCRKLKGKDTHETPCKPTTVNIEQIGKNELSIDALPVPPRGSQEPNQDNYGDTQINLTRRDIERVEDEVNTTFPKNTQPEDTSSPSAYFDEMSQAGCVQAALGTMNGASEVDNNISNIFRGRMEGIVWETVTSFLTENMTMDDFKRFLRKLAARTSAPFYETVDTTIDDVQTEERYSTERKYQLMKRWRESAPAATVEDISNILRECQFHQICEQLEGKLLHVYRTEQSFLKTNQ